MQGENTSVERGIFIVLEGTDRSGKTLQSQNIYEYLTGKGRKCVRINFPDRSTSLGKTLDGYLKKSIKLAPEVSHLLFTANRWELHDYIKTNLQNGVDVVCDRYSFSGIAYSSGAIKLDFEWCKSREEGLISPDVVIFLDVNLGLSSGRSGFGGEIYENIQDQSNVYKAYQKFTSYSFWHSVNASQDPKRMMNCIHASGSYFGNVFNHNSFRPNTSIRYITSNLHQRYGTNQLSMLPKYEAGRIGGTVEDQNDSDNEWTQILTNSGLQLNDKLMGFIRLLSKGIMAKQVIDISLGDTKYIAVILSKNLNSLIFDNFGGVLLEVPLKFVVDISYSDFSSERNMLVNGLSNRKGYEPVKVNEEIQYLVSIDVGAQVKSIFLLFSSETDAISFCANLCELINFLNTRRLI
ncbi:thymidylate kinase [Cryptosporidium canis]|uniref:dTMP kinase n=1 Tax=Cryptosporidium canis TaxID=195482 RepID=A0ABQ8P3C3_9CRYT|nr:thymidylate kinase [Cryptosporidium canis]